MPLVRISPLRRKPDGFGRKVGLVYDPDYLDIERGDGFIAIQITLSEGRSVETKKAFYRCVAEDLRRELDVRPQDVFMNLVEVKKENWSFGNGIAQYVT
jgi:phenylpyruvate tautomerase PptA (4-oxalocrotonate tautomerase family)